MNKGFVYLIGAGPGDKGLMTIKGLEALKRAEVVIYDHLASASLLNEVNINAELICAGKRAGQHYMKQEETNALLVEKALEGKVVARLKGGDPLIFGRGGEEALELKANGIDFEIIPGISSSYAVAAYNGIPVTHRKLASSFHVITGHEDAGKKTSVLDYETLAKEEGSLIFLMGLANLPNIVSRLIACGKDPKTPAAVMQEGTTARQRMAVGTLETIVEKVREQHIQTPAITIIGDVVSLHQSLDWYGHQPLSGKRILLTASDVMMGEMRSRITALGGEPVEFGLIHTQPVIGDDFDEALKNIDRYTWIVLTSRNGVDIFFEQLKQRRVDVRRLSHIRFAVIGQGTAQALESKGIFCDCVPTLYSSSDLAKTLLPKLTKTDHVLLLRAREASKILPEQLTEAGIAMSDIAVYQTVADKRKAEELGRIVPTVDYITFCSSSAVRAFVDMYGQNAMDAKVICIGPVTAKTAQSQGLDVYKTAKQYDIDGLIERILEDQI